MPLPAVPVGAAGAAGVVRGVAGTMSDSPLNPPEVTIRMRTRYVVPFASPVTRSGLVVDAGERVDHVEPPSREYETFEAAEPYVKAMLSERSPGVMAVMSGAVASGTSVVPSEASE